MCGLSGVVSLTGQALLPFLQRHLNFLHHLGSGIVPGKEIPLLAHLKADLLPLQVTIHHLEGESIKGPQLING